MRTPTVLREHPLTCGQAAAYVQEIFGRRIHVATISRWCREGLTAANGDRVHLEWSRGPGRNLITSQEALIRFFERLNAESEDATAVTPAPVPPREPRQRSPKQRQADRERADQRLAAAGLK